jgi:Kef-type K+ transport system membrane component KefB
VFPLAFLDQLLPNVERMHHFQFLVEIALILLAVKGAGHLSTRLGQPSVLGKLLVGLLLGPAALGWLHMTPFIKELSEVGVIMLMFLAGLETDVAQFKKAARGASMVAVAGVLIPFLGGWMTAVIYGYQGTSAIFVGVLLVATSVSISVQTLRELGRLQSREGVTILGAAVIDDVLGVIILSAVLGLAGGGGTDLAGLAVRIPLFFALAALVGRKLVPPFLRWLMGFRVGAPLAAGSFAVALLFAYGAEGFGIAGIVGAYLAGLMLATTDLHQKVTHTVEGPSFAFFVPFFFISVGLNTEVSGLSGPFYLMALLLSLVAILTKLIGCGGGAMMAGFDRRSALAIGAGMVARGEVGLIVATIGQDRGLIGPELFTAMVLLSLITTLVTPPMLKAIFRAARSAKAE